jgi:hypothetical protein
MRQARQTRQTRQTRQVFHVAAAGVCLLALAVTAVPAQDPLVVAPQAYQRELENDWVRVVRVRYAPHEKLPPHYHTERAAAYVYLNDGGPVLFEHVDLSYRDVVRPATKAGSYRLFRGIKEVHSVENPNDVESHFLRVELKTEPVDLARLRGKYFREAIAPDENLERLEFENGQLRITRVVVAPGEHLQLQTSAAEPALLVALIPARLAVARGGDVRGSLDLAAGDPEWLEAASRLRLENTGEDSAELLRFDFKTQPFDDPDDRTEVHDHDHHAAEPTGGGAG